MFNFLKKGKKYRVINLHMTASSKDINVGVEDALKLYSDLTELHFVDFSINYKDPLDFKKLKLWMHKFDGDIESLIFYTSMDQYCISIAKIFSGTEKDVYEILIAVPSGLRDSDVIELVKGVNKHFSIVYGYSRSIPLNYSYGEEPIKWSIFGRSLQVNTFGTDWLIKPNDHFSSGFKGFYPINFINKSLTNSYVESIASFPGVSVFNLNEDVQCIEINESALSLIKKQIPEARSYVRGDL